MNYKIAFYTSLAVFAISTSILIVILSHDYIREMENQKIVEELEQIRDEWTAFDDHQLKINMEMQVKTAFSNPNNVVKAVYDGCHFTITYIPPYVIDAYFDGFKTTTECDSKRVHNQWSESISKWNSLSDGDKRSFLHISEDTYERCVKEIGNEECSKLERLDKIKYGEYKSPSGIPIAKPHGEFKEQEYTGKYNDPLSTAALNTTITWAQPIDPNVTFSWSIKSGKELFGYDRIHCIDGVPYGTLTLVDDDWLIDQLPEIPGKQRMIINRTGLC